MKFEQHPLSAAFPSMPPAEIEALAMDIEKHGQREKGIVLDGMVLDGWHRYLACQKAGAQFKAEEFAGEDPVGFVLSRNLHRRHLTASQRAAVVVACHEWRPNGISRGAKLHGLATKAEMAGEAQVSERTIVHAKQAHEAGLGGAVSSGEVSAERAAKVAKLPKAKRAKALKEPTPAKEKKATAGGERLQARIKELEDQVERQQEAIDALDDTSATVTAFKGNTQFREMEALRLELRSVKRRRDELMRENDDLKSECKRWRKKAEAKK